MTHPQLFEALPKPIEDALRASIRRFGVIVPIVQDQHGAIIDGRHRKRIADELGATYRVDTVQVADEAEADEIQRTLNADRRQLDEEQRRAVAAELRREGHSIRSIAGALGVPPATAQRDTAGVSPDTPDGRSLGADGKSYPAKRPPITPEELDRLRPENFPPLPDFDDEPDDEPEPEPAPAPARAAAPVWSDDERELQDRMNRGETVVVSMRGAHNNLIRWADSAGRYVRIDRRTEWGNPFEIPGDGDRDTVIVNYQAYYLPHKQSLLSKLDSLRGKALGCWCAPEPCHGDVLREAAQE